MLRGGEERLTLLGAVSLLRAGHVTAALEKGALFDGERRGVEVGHDFGVAQDFHVFFGAHGAAHGASERGVPHVNLALHFGAPADDEMGVGNNFSLHAPVEAQHVGEVELTLHRDAAVEESVYVFQSFLNGHSLL